MIGLIGLGLAEQIQRLIQIGNESLRLLDALLMISLIMQIKGGTVNKQEID